MTANHVTRSEVTPAISLALAGQPNVGKSTVFNLLTGLNQHVGNWPGKTIEFREGAVEHHGVTVRLVDLPGTYSLTAASPEEMIARDYIIRQRPDVVLVVINAASLERNLYLVAELLALPAPLVIGLNMMDVAREEGYEIKPDELATAIGVPVVPMVASRNIGVHELLDVGLQVALRGPEREVSSPGIRPDHAQALARLRSLLDRYVPAPYPADWVASKLLEGDAEITGLVRAAAPADVWSPAEALLREHEDAFVAVASGRYEWIRRVTRAALVRPRAGRISLTQRLDAVATHPFLGLIVLAVVLAVIFGATYALGGPLQRWISAEIVDRIARWATAATTHSPPWVRGLVVDGVLGGVGIIFTFVPILAVFFAAMGALEDVGYMARAAYVADRFMHPLGLHGKSFMPLFLGFGCNVPAVMATRIIESEPSRLLTIMLVPLVPCTARLAVLAVLTQVLFPAHAAFVMLALTMLPLLVLAFAGMGVSRLLLKGAQPPFIMELPLYHLPNARTISILVWQRLAGFLQKASTVILGVSVVVWALSTLPHGDIETSLLASVGRSLSPVASLMGLDWRQMVALLTSFVAKENAVATLGVLYGVSGQGPVVAALATHFTAASALAFLVAEMLFIPCASTVVAIRQETRSWKWAALSVAMLTALTVLGGMVAYQVGMRWL